MTARGSNPVRLVVLALIGSALMASVWFLGLLAVPWLPAHGSGLAALVWSYRLRAVAYLLPGFGGLALMLWAEGRFQRGFQDDVWTQPQLDGVRRLLSARVWRVVGFVTVPAVVVGLAVHRQGAFVWLWYVLLMPTQLVQRLRRMLSPRETTDSGLKAWRTWKPLHSEHWGEERA